MPVDIFGHPAEMTPILTTAAENGLVVIEDAAQSFGADDDTWPVGTMGDAVTFSFFPTKNFPGIGDGGMIVARDETLAERIRRLRFHGSKDKVVFEEVGYNSRLDELQAAVIRIFLPHLDRWNAGRRQAADWYRECGLGDYMTLPAERPGAKHVYHLYMARHPRRDEIRAGLGRRGHRRGRLLRHPDAPAAGVPAPGLLARATCPSPRSTRAPGSRCPCTRT